MKFEKPAPEMLTWFEGHAPEGTGISKRKMFGFPCRFFNNNMFMGLFQSKVFIGLSPADKEKFLTIDDVEQFEPLPGRIMKEYVILPQRILKDSDELTFWINRSLKFISSLPPK